MLCNVFEHNAVNKIIYDSQFEICSTILCAFCCSWNVCEGRTDEFFDTVAGKLICWRRDRSLKIFARNLEFLRESDQKTWVSSDFFNENLKFFLVLLVILKRLSHDPVVPALNINFWRWFLGILSQKRSKPAPFRGVLINLFAFII